MAKTELTLWRALARTISGRSAELGSFAEPELLGFAERHGIVPMLSRRIHEGLDTGLAQHTRQSLQAMARQQAALDIVQNDATRAFIELLDAEGHPCLLLKGAALAHLKYPDSWLRPRSDTDAFIRRGETGAIARLLEKAGYSVTGADPARRSSRQFVAMRESFRGHRVCFDIHWSLSNRSLFDRCLTFDDCLTTSGPVPSLAPGARTLSEADLLLHACLHRIAHGRNVGRDRLIWLYDIHLLIAAMPESRQWQFAEQALARSVGSVCAEAFAVCAEAFATPLPENFLARLTGNRDREPSARLVHAGKLAWAWSDFRGQPGIRERWRFVRELLANRLQGQT